MSIVGLTGVAACRTITSTSVFTGAEQKWGRAEIPVDPAELHVFDGLIEDLGHTTPCITPIKPSGPFHLEDLGEAGGIQAVMKQLGGLIHRWERTVDGEAVGENVDRAIVLHGNLAESAIVRPTGSRSTCRNDR